MRTELVQAPAESAIQIKPPVEAQIVTTNMLRRLDGRRLSAHREDISEINSATCRIERGQPVGRPQSAQNRSKSSIEQDRKLQVCSSTVSASAEERQ